jgi:hypothetical protein
MYRLSFDEQWKPRAIWYGHAKTVQHMMKEPVFQMGIDKMMPRHIFHLSLMVSFPERSERERGSIPIKKGGLIWFTHGSKTH